MKHSSNFLVLLVGFMLYSFSYSFSQDVPAHIKKLAETKLVKWASSSEITSAVKTQNAKNISLDEIKQEDQKWIATSGVDDFMKDMLANSCSSYLKSLLKQNPYFTEIFVMDNKGANVGMSNKTSDYWQGDEDKFIKCYNNGNGTTFFGKLSFDESTQAYTIQVSVPVKESGKTIGAVTFGIDPAKVK
jgi:hypothetical protein